MRSFPGLIVLIVLLSPYASKFLWCQNLLNINGYLYQYPCFFPAKTDLEKSGLKGNVKSVKTINLLWDTVTVVKEVYFRPDGNFERITYKGLEQRFTDQVFYYDAAGRLDSTVEIKTINNFGIVGYGLLKTTARVKQIYTYKPDYMKCTEYSFTYIEGIDSVLIDSSYMEERYSSKRLSERTWYDFRSGEPKVSAHYSYAYSDKDHRITKTAGSYLTYYCFNSTNKVLTKYYEEKYKDFPQTFEFNASGHLIKVTSIFSPYLPPSIATFDYDYDESGNIIRQQYGHLEDGKQTTLVKLRHIIEYY